VPAVEDQGPIQAFLPHGAYPALGEAFATGTRTGVVRISARTEANTASKPRVTARTGGTAVFHIPANNPIEADHGRLKARLWPMRGLKRLRSAARIAAGHAFVQNLRRGHYELAPDARPRLRLATAFTELALAV
jgi:hypothetical protein